MGVDRKKRLDCSTPCTHYAWWTKGSEGNNRTIGNCRQLQPHGIPMKEKVKYLGMLLGYVTEYAALIARALQRTQFMKQLLLTHTERAALLQEWVLPLFILPARAYFPTDAEINKFNTIHRTAVNVGSWGLTIPVTQLPSALGGDSLPWARTFLLWQHAVPFVFGTGRATKIFIHLGQYACQMDLNDRVGGTNQVV